MMTQAIKLLCATLLFSYVALAPAQTYPTRSVRVIVPFAPSGGTDILARSIAHEASASTGQQFIVENRAGANSGQVALSFGSLPGLAPCVKAGKLRALARWKKVIASANIRAE